MALSRWHSIVGVGKANNPLANLLILDQISEYGNVSTMKLR